MLRRTVMVLLSSAVATVGAVPLSSSAAAAPARPIVTSVSPATATPSGGVRVTVKGRGFVHVTKVVFGNTVAKHVTVISRFKLIVTAPAHAPGRLHVKVLTPAGWSLTSVGNRFTYIPPA